jgi:ABC-type transport system involved in multi-copper enzyme maturation permease subunit
MPPTRRTAPSTTKWLEIVRFELVYQLRRRAVWVFFAVFLFFLWGNVNDQVTNAGNREILFNAPLLVAQTSGIMSLVALLVIAAVAGDAATRDVQTRLEPLIHAAPIGRAAYLGGRFLGAFIVSAIVLAMVPLVLMLAPFVHSGLSAELVGPFRPAVYLQSYFLLILPNVFVGTALLLRCLAIPDC